MNSGNLGKFGLALTLLGMVTAATLGVLIADPLARILAGVIFGLCALAAVVVALYDGHVRAQRHILTQALQSADVSDLDAFGAALATERKRAGAVLSLGPAVEEIVVRHAKLSAALQSEESALGETRSASSDSLTHLQTTGDSVTTLSRSVDDSSAAIEEMVSSIRLVSDNIGGIADTVNSVSSAIGELAVSISQVAGTAREANTLSLEADTKARDGGKAVERLVESTREIATDISSVVLKMQELGEASARIGNIVEVIDNIADQTNLLALNAAIEAARAGEHGRGFAVVADEVRKLAENSASSTREIGVLVKDIQAKTDEVVRSTTASGTKAESGLQMADLAGRAITDILEAVAEASRLIDQISTAAKEQALGSAAIVNSVEQMNTLMREAARSLDEQNTSNGQMIATITQMQRLTDTVNVAVAKQREASQRIDLAARRLTDASKASRDTFSGIDDVAGALRERIATLSSEIHRPRQNELEHAGNGFARLGSGH
jgi:methyl-accepting chemotaxis protein